MWFVGTKAELSSSYENKDLRWFTRSDGPGTRASVLLWAAAAEAAVFIAAAAPTERATFTAAVTFTALRVTVLYRTDHSILSMDLVMIMTVSSVIILYSVASGPGPTPRTISAPILTTIIPLPVTAA
jgi:hypothetical protein